VRFIARYAFLSFTICDLPFTISLFDRVITFNRV
jgi:hypothetical protein